VGLSLKERKNQTTPKFLEMLDNFEKGLEKKKKKAAFFFCL